jgi:hypothetical protein
MNPHIANKNLTGKINKKKWYMYQRLGTDSQ